MAKTRTHDINGDGRLSWKEHDVKDKIAYFMACLLISSGIIMAFLCFFMTDNHDITNGVLFYVSEAFVTVGSLLGIGIYIKNKFGEINSLIHSKLDNKE